MRALCCIIVALAAFTVAHGFLQTRQARLPKAIIDKSRYSYPKVDEKSLQSSRMDDPDMAGQRGLKGYYRRPSRAIEKGGGFFVPGLEGERIRVLTASAIFVLFAINRIGVQTSSVQQLVSEFTGIAVTALLFAQGVAQGFPEQIRPSSSPTGLADNSAGSASSLLQGSSTGVGVSYVNVLQSSLDANSLQFRAVKSLSYSLLQTVENLSHVIIIPRHEKNDKNNKNDNNNVNVNGKKNALLELGSLGLRASDGVSLERVLQTTPSTPELRKELRIESRQDFDGRTGNAISFASDVGVVAMFEDSRGWLWVFGSNGPPQSFMKNRPWIQSVIAVNVE